MIDVLVKNEKEAEVVSCAKIDDIKEESIVDQLLNADAKTVVQSAFCINI